MENFLERALQIKVDINDARKIWDRMCIAELKNETNKSMIMKNEAKLREIRRPVRLFANPNIGKEKLYKPTIRDFSKY